MSRPSMGAEGYNIELIIEQQAKQRGSCDGISYRELRYSVCLQRRAKLEFCRSLSSLAAAHVAKSCALKSTVMAGNVGWTGTFVAAVGLCATGRPLHRRHPSWKPSYWMNFGRDPRRSRSVFQMRSRLCLVTLSPSFLFVPISLLLSHLSI